jgi:hypothetical protein
VLILPYNLPLARRECFASSQFHCISWKHAFLLHLKLLGNRKEPETGFMVEAALDQTFLRHP